MLKAMLIVTAISGVGDYSVEMPSMKQCLDARIAITKQDDSVKTLCVPKADETVKVREFFNIFMDMISTMKEMEYENEYNLGEENCKRPFGSIDCTE